MLDRRGQRTGVTETVPTTPQPALALGADVASDSFSRSLSGNWGSAECGGSYTLSTASSFNVTSSAGTLTLPSANSTR